MVGKLFSGSSWMVEVGEPVRDKAVGTAPDEIFVCSVEWEWCRELLFPLSCSLMKLKQFLT